MSLLLQALKKAEEDKRRRAALAQSEPPLAEVEFPTLNLVEDVVEDAVEIPMLEIAVEDVASAATNIQLAEEFMPLAEAETATPIEIVQLESPAPIAAPEEAIPPIITSSISSQPPKSAPESPAAEPVKPVPIPAPQNAPQALAKSMFAKRPRPQGRGLLPWLVLGASLLLAGMLAWFTWQYRQLTQPIPSVVVNPAASAPAVQSHSDGYVNEPSATEDLHEDTPSNDVATTTVAPAAAIKPLESAPTNPNKPNQPAPRLINEGGELNLPPKFIRQTANLSAAEPVLLAWQAYQSGDFAQAERIYRKVLVADPRQRDALLGLAAIAQQRGDLADAESLYQRLLRFNPQDEAAKAALLGLNSAQMPEKDAVQLEQTGKADPLVLGHYFAAQQRWSQAQEQFFLAYTANPNNADAALNLAVSLDHLNQTALARSYYRKALQAKEQINFDRSKVEQRLLELDTAAEQKP